jgi:arylesterase/paraoxonase
MKALEDPVNTNCPSTIFRIRKLVDEHGKARYEVVRILEDIEGAILPCSTVAVHDAITDTFYMGSVTSPFITVCSKNT